MSEREPDADDTEAVWRTIVENYGDRAVVEPDEYDEAPAPAPSGHDAPDEQDLDDGLDDEERYVPPPAPPLPRPSTPRLLAWIGLLGSPVVVVVTLLAGISLPPVVGWLLIAAFVGGFGYLVATMPREPRDPWDDGAQV
ncbi:MAG: hypothetical protein FWE71_16480 [Nocardioidaceae bacterium]|nr:hypothetical protein [Nocardioidaceae bacterium]MCL2614475.1 hypothetical protein [Nocardioidaceae bacterium]